MLGVIGCGKMGLSIINGVLDKQIICKNDLLLYDAYEKTNIILKEKGFAIANNELDLYNKCDYILIAVKPQNIFELLEKLKINTQEKTIMSIAAGISIKKIKNCLNNVKVARIMPNTPTLISKGCSVLSYDKLINNNDKKMIENIFSSIGTLDIISEELMDDIIPISGSFPAYGYYFMNAFIKSAVSRGINKDLAKKLVVESMIGSAEMIKIAEKDISLLIDDVCSPGGTTIEGINVFDKYDLEKIVDEASISCAKKSKELGNNK